MATFNDLNSEEKREYVEQGLEHFSALKRAILDASVVKSEALADGEEKYPVGNPKRRGGDQCFEDPWRGGKE